MSSLSEEIEKDRQDEEKITEMTMRLLVVIAARPDVRPVDLANNVKYAVNSARMALLLPRND